MPSFEAEVQQLKQGTYVRIAGKIDEDAELAPIAGRVRGELALINLAGVLEINNCGVRDWVRWVGDVRAKGSQVVMLECSPSIVAQLNQVSNFAGGAIVKSFYVPYFCQSCDAEKSMLVDIEELDPSGPARAPTCRCDTCDGVMAFDDLEESYFGFVKDVNCRIPDNVNDVIEDLAPSGGERKVISRNAMSSTFTGILSAVSQNRPGFGASTSVPSADALRRLRDKTGMRSTRRAEPSSEVEAAPAASGGGNTWIWVLGAVTLVALAGAVVALVM